MHVMIYLVILVTLAIHVLLFFIQSPDTSLLEAKSNIVLPDVHNINRNKYRMINHSLVTLVEELHQVKTKTKSLLSGYNTEGNRSQLSKVLSSVPKRKKVLIFTMDSIESYESNSLIGGAAGEILIRKSLENAFIKYLDVDVHVCTSDQEFEQSNVTLYDFVILDPWTWAGPGWIPKTPIRGQEHKLYLLDFFGSQKLKGHLDIPLSSRLLTAFGSPWNTFLGYYIDNSSITTTTYASEKRKIQGIVWGKDPKHYHGKESILTAAAERIPLLSCSTTQVMKHRNFLWQGHQSVDSWFRLLRTSKFLLGIGHPLLGPSAIDAVVAGAVYINPQYSAPVKGYNSQHPYAETRIGMPYVCSYPENDHALLLKCIDHALSVDLPPLIPQDFLLENYLARVKSIFNL